MHTATAKKLEMYRAMLLTRRFEEALSELCKIEGTIHGMMILCTGQEGVAAGVCAALEPADAIITNHRSHGHLLAKGADPNTLMAEIFGRATGCNRGKSGTLHLAVPEINAPCTSTVVGAGPPIAVGRAFAQQYRDEQAVTVCFIGDGAADEGSFHEALNLAALWQLPVLFVCENNLYAMGTALRYTQSSQDIAAKGAAYNMAAAAVDGMDVQAVEAATRGAVDRIRAGEGPFLLECRTYRFRPHSMFDSELYRTKDEVAEWRERDPIELLAGRMTAAGLLDEAGRAALEREVTAEVEAAVAFAEAGTWEPVEELTRFVTSEGRAS